MANSGPFSSWDAFPNWDALSSFCASAAGSALTSGPAGAYTPLFASAWAERRLADRLASSVIARLPRLPDALPASLWLEKR